MPDLVIWMSRCRGATASPRATEITGKRIAPVVVLTAFSQRDLVERARDAGAMAYLVKPFSPHRPARGDPGGASHDSPKSTASSARSATPSSG